MGGTGSGRVQGNQSVCEEYRRIDLADLDRRDGSTRARIEANGQAVGPRQRCSAADGAGLSAPDVSEAAGSCSLLRSFGAGGALGCCTLPNEFPHGRVPSGKLMRFGSALPPAWVRASRMAILFHRSRPACAGGPIASFRTGTSRLPAAGRLVCVFR